MDKEYLKAFANNMMIIFAGVLAFFSFGKISEQLGYDFIYGPLVMMMIGFIGSVFMLGVTQVDSKRRQEEHERIMAKQKKEREKRWKDLESKAG